MIVQGTFDISAEREPPYDSADGVVLGRTRFEKRFHGALDAASSVAMLSAGTPVKGSAAYVALERVVGRLDGRAGSFVLAHLGVMNRGAPSLTLTVVPDSGSGELVGLTGRMSIDVAADGKHSYAFDYELPAR